MDYGKRRTINGVDYFEAGPFYRLDSKGKGTPSVMSYKCPICRIHSRPVDFYMNPKNDEELKEFGVYRCPFCNVNLFLIGESGK